MLHYVRLPSITLDYVRFLCLCWLLKLWTEFQCWSWLLTPANIPLRDPADSVVLSIAKIPTEPQYLCSWRPTVVYSREFISKLALLNITPSAITRRSPSPANDAIARGRCMSVSSPPARVSFLCKGCQLKYLFYIWYLCWKYYIL